ncbi:MAG: VCBS repeat-containing protein [Planctomycetaceae bacterium]|nr:VCBS repeat-containing protein [Planctomycetaceae bacterium]
MLALEQYADARRLADSVLMRDPGSVEALRISGDAALGEADLDAAAEFLVKVPGGRRRAATAYFEAAQSAIRVARLSEGERFLRAALRLDERHREATRELAKLLSVEARRREAAPLQLQLIQAEHFSIEELLLLSNREDPYYDLPLLDRALAAVPDDPVPLIGKAVAELHKNQPAAAADLLREVVEKVPAQAEAQALLGRALFDLGAFDEWRRRQRTLPAGCDDHPDIWAVRGFWAEARGQKEEAVRCLWEAIRRDPNHRRANFSLGQALTALGRPEDAALYLDRAAMLSELHDRLHPLFREGPRVPVMLRAGELMNRLGRPWEAWAWYLAVAALDPQNAAAAAERDRLAALLREQRPPRMLSAADPSLRLDLSDYPLPHWTEPSGSSERLASRSGAGPAFADVAAAAGIDFEYFNNGAPGLKGYLIYQSVGGGVAVFDLDADGRPDLHFTQGCRWPPRPGQAEHLDRCFRNLGTRFVDVTAPAGLGDERYGQGPAAGDFNGDGFADLYVANIGGNRLYRNNGDGTFTDVAEQVGVAGDRWTTSCVMADLDGDGFADLFNANYVQGGGVYDRLCGDPPRGCAPSNFDGVPDQIYHNLGDGHWADVSTAAELNSGPPGKGLGVVAADFHGSGRLDLFVANDTEANFFYANLTPSLGQPLAFSEEALSRGLAFDVEGRTQACMGVACDDADGDGLLDLFVTNYWGEPNTLYLQEPGGLFLDRTHESGLRDPSWPMLGFGSQFLDAELDGLPDLVVANGHIDDFTHRDQPHRMRPQFFRNLGGGRFAESPSESLGPWFEGEYLGRGLARLDWNADGLEDFAVSHLHGSAALVENRTADPGRFIAVRLVGVRSARDAIGATVTVKAGGRTRAKQLTAGDGYMASNERRLVFGLGDHVHADELTVRWPSGLTQDFRRVAAGLEYLLIEGRHAPFLLPRNRFEP